MLSVRSLTGTVGRRASLRQIATGRGMAPPVSVHVLLTGRPLLRAVPAGPLEVEATSQVVNGVVHVTTDNPQLKITVQLTAGHADWAGRVVPQEVTSRGSAWSIANTDLTFEVWDGEEAAGARPSRAGSLSDSIPAWPAADGHWSGEHGTAVTLYGRALRVGYQPVQVRFTASTPRGRVAGNSGAPVRVALDPEVLLVPVEVVLFHAPGFARTTTMQEQMLIWDQVPSFSATGNTRITDGTTGELTAVERAWDAWPVLGPDGMYQHRGVLSPDGVWGKAGVRFRLVNYFEIATDRDHVVQPDRPGAPSALRDNLLAVRDDPRHVDDRVLVVIVMHRVTSRADDLHVGQALIGEGALGVSWGVSDRLTVIPHEIGHLITGSAGHSSEPDNVMQATGGTEITPGQAARAREWAGRYAGFWRRP